ncbi:MAG: hypothetical protein ACI4EN_04975, partial [Butyrivibrio sp.]
MDKMGKNNFIKRKLSILLAFLIMFTSSVCNMTFDIKAEEVRIPFGIYINNQYAAQSEQLTFDYGVTLSPEVYSTDTALIMWICEADYKPESAEWKLWSELPDNPLPGKYYIGFNDYAENSKVEDSDKYSFTIQAAKLDAPTDVRWNGLTVSWSEVNTASVTGAMDSTAESDAVIDENSLKGYKVKLYKDSIEKYNTIVTDTKVDLSEKITGFGYGSYTVEVIAESSDTTRYLNSDAV